MKKFLIFLVALSYAAMAHAELKTYTIEEGKSISQVIPYSDMRDLDSMKVLGSIQYSDLLYINGLCRQFGTLRYVDISETTGLTEIADGCFANVSTLQTLILPSSITRIGDNAFNQASKLEEINIPDGVTYIGQFAFYGCSKLKGTPLPDGLETVGECAFMQCLSFGPQMVIPSSVSSIGVGAFTYMQSLKTLTVGDGNSNYKAVDNVLYTSDGKVLLSAAGGIEGTVNVLEGTEEVQSNAFAGAESIKEINIPASVATIGDYAFDFAYSLGSINVASENASYASVDGVLFNKEKTLLMIYPQGREAEEYTTPGSVTAIGVAAFANNTKIKKVYLNEGLKEIRDYGFDETSTLEYVSFPKSLEMLGYQVFAYNNKLDNIVLPENITVIPENTFAECPNLVNVTLHDGITLIGTAAFLGCSSLEEIKLPENLLIIYNGAFQRTGLKSVVIPEGVKTIDMNVFYNSPNLRTVVLPSTLTEIGSSSFGNTTLASVTCNAVTPPAADYAFMFADLDNAELTVPAESVDAYKAAEGWKDFYNITSGVKAVTSNTVTHGTDTYYDAQGRKLNAMKRGLNIVKGSDGSTRKVMMK